MMDDIKRDHARFRAIVKGRIQQNLKSYITQSEIIGRKGKDWVSIPIPQIELPRFRYGQNEQTGVGQGAGAPGTPLGDSVSDSGSVGNQPGKHLLEVDLSLDELAEILGKELELPKIQPRGHHTLQAQSERYTSIAHQGPNSLRHFKRTFKETLQRQIASGAYDSNHPVLIPIQKDMRYRSWKSVVRHENNAVIIYMMDVSGSMGNEQKEIVRTEAFWINTWLQSQYPGIETRYIIHDALAREVDEETFFNTKESGGTLISSAYRLCKKIIENYYSPLDWNIYIFHFSDGDNWSGEDTRHSIDVLENSLLKVCNMFCYGQVESRYGSGQFFRDLRDKFGAHHPGVILSKIENKSGIFESIQNFLGKGN